MVELGIGGWKGGHSKIGQGMMGLKRPAGNIGNNSDCPANNDWLNELWHIHTME